MKMKKWNTLTYPGKYGKVKDIREQIDPFCLLCDLLSWIVIYKACEPTFKLFLQFRIEGTYRKTILDR